MTQSSKGYFHKPSAAIAQHDVDVDPRFIDWRRSLPLFDTKYLGHTTVPMWSAGATYQVGDEVQYCRVSASSWGVCKTDAQLASGDYSGLDRDGIYWGLPVNLRYINRTGCNGENRKPLTGANDHANTGYNNWRQCWEWASLYHIRQSIANFELIDDESIGAYADPMTLVLIKWIRAGYTPTNSALHNAAHDGTDIGAVPVAFAPPQTADGPVSGGPSVRIGGKVKTRGKVSIH